MPFSKHRKKLVFTGKPYVEETQEASSPSTPPGQSSPSIARRFRKLLPSGGDDKKDTKGKKGLNSFLLVIITSNLQMTRTNGHAV